MNKPVDKVGISTIAVTRDERRLELVARLQGALRQEVALLREKNDSPMNDIKDTTLLRGELRAVKRILAQLDEVGPESRQSDPLQEWAESAPPPASAAGFQPGNEP
jgi:hypothetical protein